jgi:hypothetical protein
MRTVISLLLLAVLAVPSCSSVKSPTPQQLIDCAKVDLGKTLPDIGITAVADVLQILGSNDWETALGNIAVKYGEDTLACALQVVKSQATVGSGSAASPARDRAKGYIAKQGWKFASQ